MLERMYISAKALPPTSGQAKTEDEDNHPLFRAFPVLRGKLAWRQLGNFPTPVHRFSCSLPNDGPEVTFW
eukprot:12315630-Alexandrium_andersonii.AAC.1